MEVRKNAEIKVVVRVGRMISKCNGTRFKSKHPNEVRCDCGRLYLVKTKDGYEFKCPRCKRIHLLKYEELIVTYLTKEEKDVAEII